MIPLFKRPRRDESGNINKQEHTSEPTIYLQQPMYQYDPYKYQDPLPFQGYNQQPYYPSYPQTLIPQQNPIQYSSQSPTQEYNLESWESYIQGIVEEAIEGKLENINNLISELKAWKEKIELEVSKINDRINNLEGRINNLYEMIANKIKEYDKGIREATVEVEALHRLIRTMIPAISESTKELRETIEEIKNLRDQLKRP